MIFRQFVLPSLGHASYLVGDERTGEALVLDPRRDVEGYFAAARAEGLRITRALDTHGHNDYLSGLSELALRGGVRLLGSAEATLGYDHEPLSDGQVMEVGDLGFEVLHTPGHTPEHISLVVYDRSIGSEPVLLLSGGALLVGDIARPDLLGGPEDARQAARVFCEALQAKILTLPDHIEVFPTHVAGSLCGGNIGSRLSTTVGLERRTNPVLVGLSGAEEFVRECIRLDNLPAVPPYWKRMRGQNLAGVRPLGVLREVPALQPEQVEAMAASGAVVLDTRSAEAFAGGHIPGAVNVALGSSFATWAGTVLPEDAEVVLVLDDPEQLAEATWQLLRIGYEVPAGWLAGGMYAWRTSGRTPAFLPQLTVHELREQVEAGKVAVLDVRQPAEWHDGHIEGAIFLTGARLPAALDEVPRDRPLAIMCGSGFRSSVGASYLLAHGFGPVVNVLGGMSAWTRNGYPTIRDDDKEAA